MEQPKPLPPLPPELEAKVRDKLQADIEKQKNPPPIGDNPKIRETVGDFKTISKEDAREIRKLQQQGKLLGQAIFQENETLDWHGFKWRLVGVQGRFLVLEGVGETKRHKKNRARQEKEMGSKRGAKRR